MFELAVLVCQPPIWEFGGMHNCDTSSLLPGTIGSARQPFNNHGTSWTTHLAATQVSYEKSREYTIYGHIVLRSA